jgi:heme-degrading monooxygenase HmoA
MFIHAVLFQIKPQHVRIYKKDCRMWASYAAKAKGFLQYSTLKRVNEKNQYTSVYRWKAEAYHKRFMDAWHDKLVAKSHCPVKVLGYYNFEVVQKG